MAGLVPLRGFSDVQFTDAQLSFLEDNFVVYDAPTGQCHSDFSRLKTCQLVLMGEYHRSLLIRSIQNKFFELIDIPQNSCLLVEGLPPGIRLELPELQHIKLPESMTVLGSDNRDMKTKEDYLKYQSLDNQRMELSRSFYEKTKKPHERRIAHILNAELAEANAKVSQKKAALRISKEAYQKIKISLKSIMTCPEFRQIQELTKAMREAVTDLKNAKVLSSNQGLFQEIIKAVEVFQKVYSIWGLHHYVNDDDLLFELANRGISYIIILPKNVDETELDGKLSEAKLKLRYVSKKEQDGEKIRQVVKTVSIYFDKMSINFLQPVIQQIIRKSANYLVFDKSLVETAQNNQLCFQANTVLKLNDLNTTDFNAIHDLLVTTQMTHVLTQEEEMKIQERLVSGINGILLFNNLRLTRLLFTGNIHYSLNYEDYKSKLCFSSDKPFIMIFNNRYLICTTTFLFKEMNSKNRRAFTVLSDQTLVFKDVTAEEINKYISQPEEIIPFLNSKLLKNQKVELLGEGITVHSLNLQVDDGVVECLGITSHEGDFTIKLLQE